MAKANRLEALTGLRIFAALAVYLSHTGPPHGTPEPLATFFRSGYMGVTVFFVLSGFVISLNYFDALRRPTLGKVWNYAVARVARVYPLYIVVLVYVIVNVRTHGGSIDGWWRHALAIQAWSGQPTVFPGNPPAWSVSVEVFLYACFPVLALLLARLTSTRRLVIAAAAVLAAMFALTLYFALNASGSLTGPHSAHRWLYGMPAARLGDFLLGIIAARVYLNLRGHPRAGRAGAWVAVISALAIVAVMAIPRLLNSAWTWDLAYAAPAALLILGIALAPAGRPSRALARPTVVLLGEASYAFYLVHYLVIVDTGADLRWAKTLTPMVLVFEAMVLGMALALAVGLHTLLEKPARARIRAILTRTPGARATTEPLGF